MPKKETPLDQRIIQWYGSKTPIEIGELTGLAPEHVMKRTQELIGQRDYLAEDAKIAVLLMRMEAMSAEIEERVPHMSDKNLPPAVNASRGLVNSVLKELRSIRQESKVDLDAINAVYSKQLADIVENSFYFYLGKLTERFPDIDPVEEKREFKEIVVSVAREHDE